MKEGKPKDVNMSLVGLGNTRTSTDYARNFPWTLKHAIRARWLANPHCGHSHFPRNFQMRINWSYRSTIVLTIEFEMVNIFYTMHVV